MRMLSLRSAKLLVQLRSGTIAAPHVHVPGVTVAAETIATSFRQLEQHRIIASQEIVVTTTALTLRISGAHDKI